MLKRKPLIALAGAAVIAACGDNLWELPTGSRGPSPNAPAVQIAAPGNGHRIEAGDSILVSVRVKDTDPVKTVQVSGFSVRGNPALGTDEAVDRFQGKQVDLAEFEVTDTTVTRYLLATADSLAEDSVYIVATATDAAGNTAADTVVIAIEAPRPPTVQISAPTGGQWIARGDSVLVTVRVADTDPIATLDLSGIALRGDSSLGTLEEVARFDHKRVDLQSHAVSDTTVTRYLVATPDTLSEDRVFIIATATDAAGFTAADTVVVAIGVPAAPVVRLSAPTSGQSVEAGDSILVTVRVRDTDPVTTIGLSGFAVRGNPTLGTAEKVDRFHSKRVDLSSAAVSDTTVTRYLIATSDSLAEGRVYVVASATDAAGNTAADTVTIAIDGPRPPNVEIANPIAGERIAAGDSVLVTVRVSDTNPVTTVDLTGVSVRGDSILGNKEEVVRFIGKRVDLSSRAVYDTIVTRYLRALPDTLSEDRVFLIATATDATGFTAADTVAITVGEPTAPVVTISTPTGGHRVAVGDSILVTVRASDTDPIATIDLMGLAVRGDPALGTDETVFRFQGKRVDLRGKTATDTTVSRYLLPTADSLSENRVFIIAAATDAAGNTSTDTVVIAIGGPRVHVTSPVGGAEIRAGTSLRVGVSASDPAGRVERIRISTSGATTLDSTLVLVPPVSDVDTAVVLTLPADKSGDLHITATVVTAANDSSTAAPVTVRVTPPAGDDQPPSVRFDVAAPRVAERTDSLYVTVEATDNTLLSTIGITIVPTVRGGPPLNSWSTSVAMQRHTFGVALADLGVSAPVDTATLRLEVSAFATDTASNCGAASSPGVFRSESCIDSGGQTVGEHTGARTEILLVRGRTIPYALSGERVGDLASNGSHVFVSNLTRNRVDVIEVGQFGVKQSVSVGSQPWGLAFNPGRDTLYVANSGGTNISVVAETGIGDFGEVDRIQTPNIKVFDVEFETGLMEVNTVTRHDYSDRPQYIGVTQNRNLIFSTRPTTAASDGTVRIYRPGSAGREGRLEMVTDYVENRPGGKLVVLNADSVFQLPNSLISVCPRPRSADPVVDGTLAVRCYEGSLIAVRDSVIAAGYDTKFHFQRDVEEIGLTDTTFVAISGDHSTVAFGEGGIAHARVMILVDSLGGTDRQLYKHGEISDLIGNAAERVTGLSLNEDGSMGVARGDQAYFFDNQLRLQGVVETGARAGGVDMHPDNPTQQRTFVSGIAENGLPYIDVLNSYHFRAAGRIFMRDPVTGPVRAVDTGSALLLYAVTARGIVVLEVLPDDLTDL